LDGHPALTFNCEKFHETKPPTETLRMPNPIPDASINPFSGLNEEALNEIERNLIDLRKAGQLPDGIPVNFEDLLKQARDFLKNQNSNPSAPSTSDYKPFALPASRNAVLLSACIDARVNNIPQLSKMLTSRGYTVDESSHQLTLAALRAMPGKEIGVLYLMSHATSDGTFGIATQDLESRSPEEKAFTDSDRDNHYVNYTKFDIVGLDSDGSLGNIGTAYGYNARLDFFNYYWKDGQKPKRIFADNSVVFINACDVRDREFIDLLLACNAGTVLAWDDYVAARVGVETANYFFDRMLGANRPEPEFHPELIRQRPFSWGELLLDMKNQRTRSGVPLGGPYVNSHGGTHPTTMLQFYLKPTIPGPFLAPNLEQITADEINRKLVLTGRFGPDLGAGRRMVLLSDSRKMTSARRLPIEKFTETQIVCTLQDDTAGYLQINIDDRTSNCLPVSEWKGQIVATASGDGSLKEEIVIDFALRLDAHLMRTNYALPLIGSSPEELFAAFQKSYMFAGQTLFASASNYSTLRYSASGFANYSPSKHGLAHVDISGSGQLPSASSLPVTALGRSDRTFDLTLQIDRSVTLPSSGGMFSESHDLTLSVVTPLQSPHFNISRRYAFQADRSPKLQKVQLYTAGRFLSGEVVKTTNQTAYDLPDPALEKDADASSDFNTATFHILSKANFPPDYSFGGDYFDES
jgi:hypothetical protein